MPRLVFNTESFVDAPDADALLGRTYRKGHWASV